MYLLIILTIVLKDEPSFETKHKCKIPKGSEENNHFHNIIVSELESDAKKIHKTEDVMGSFIVSDGSSVNLEEYASVPYYKK